MKAMALTGLRQMREIEIPDPVLKSDRDVILRVETIGVCGSDVHYYTTGRIGSQVVTYPFVVGHECSGTVLSVGAAVTRVRPGDRVAVEPAVSCGVCDQCRAGRPHTCRTLKFLGCPGQLDGCLCERISMPEDGCFPIRKETSLDQAALVEPLSIGVYAVRLSGLKPGWTIGILGAGPIGLCVLAAARAARVGRVYVTEPRELRRAAALRMGADWAGLPGIGPDSEPVRREPLLLDAVFECSGDQAAIDDGVHLLKPGGRLLLIGIPEVSRVSFEIDAMRRKELVVQNVRRQNGCVQAALDLIETGGVDPAPMHTHTFDLKNTPAAFDMVADYRDGVIKALIRPHRA
ncbi:MAG: alcohol dehydrogenase catalytic domain-containing protein [Kiritimatiellia bacterium]|nr:alcohol dehydrogenase catalytic domain-containing protein [Kiritimatiellia bacterium]